MAARDFFFLWLLVLESCFVFLIRPQVIRNLFIDEGLFLETYLFMKFVPPFFPFQGQSLSLKPLFSSNLCRTTCIKLHGHRRAQVDSHGSTCSISVAVLQYVQYHVGAFNSTTNSLSSCMHACGVSCGDFGAFSLRGNIAMDTVGTSCPLVLEVLDI